MVSVDLRDHDVTSAEEFLSLLTPFALARRLGAPLDGWLFRGHGDSSWPLLPRAWRTSDVDAMALLAKQLEIARAYLNRPPNDRRAEPDAHRHAERLLVRAWADECNGAGLHARGDPPANAPQGSRSRSGPNWPDPRDSITALAAHHGIPTRLLDVTVNPLAAAAFAAWDPAPSESIAVLAIRVFDPWRIDVLDPLHADNPYLHAQDGRSLNFVNPEEWYAEQRRWPTLEQHGGATVVRLTVPHSEKPQLVEALERWGVRPTRLMPSHDNATRALLIRARAGAAPTRS